MGFIQKRDICKEEYKYKRNKYMEKQTYKKTYTEEYIYRKIYVNKYIYRKTYIVVYVHNETYTKNKNTHKKIYKLKK